jgi:hypothetical protein
MGILQLYFVFVLLQLGLMTHSLKPKHVDIHTEYNAALTDLNIIFYLIRQQGCTIKVISASGAYPHQFQSLKRTLCD